MNFVQDKESIVYNKIAEDYFNNKKGFYSIGDLNYFINLIPQNSSILDLGCGPGSASKVFFDKGYSVTCMDFSEEMLKFAKRDVPHANFVLGDIRNIDKMFNKMSFDGIWACASLLHFKKYEVSDVIGEIYSILNNKGIFYMSVKEGNGEKEIFDERYNLKRYFSYFQESELRELLENHNFKIRNFSRDKSKYVSPSGNNWINFFSEKS